MFWAEEFQPVPNKRAIWDPQRCVTYGDLSAAASRVARALLSGLKIQPGAHVAFWVPPSADYVEVQWGIWRAGAVAVPLCVQHPAPELEHALREGRVSHVIHARGLLPMLATLRAALPRVEFTALEELPALSRAAGEAPLPAVDDSWHTRPAQILFTSGTTGKPKAAVATHGNIEAQVQTLLGAWGWSARDHTVGVLPLHHTHGIINVLCCALASGGSIELFEKFDAASMWDRLIRPRDGVQMTVFMAVPTIYSALLDWFEGQSPVTRTWLKDAASRLRLWVSGSAALPVSTLQRWREVSGHTLLERYGMTEIGMALSNPLAGERRAGAVGLPLPGVEVRLVDDSGIEIAGPDRSGEIQVRGAMVFSGYLGRESETRASFTADGWFKTGDTALRDEQGYYSILGRSSVDILKTGGYKVSALEIEEVLREFPGVREVAVVGVPDEKWGERVAAAVVPDGGLPMERLEEHALRRLARYKVPTLWLECRSLPRNAMGKVIKAEVVRLFSSDHR
jgi:malonyl-CoA/methylmalonyl-CoA synthetase